MAKKKAKKVGMHREVHDMWGWVVLGVGALIILSVAGFWYLNFVVV